MPWETALDASFSWAQFDLLTTETTHRLAPPPLAAQVRRLCGCYERMCRPAKGGTPSGAPVPPRSAALPPQVYVVDDTAAARFCPCDVYSMCAALWPNECVRETRPCSAYVQTGLACRSRGALCVDWYDLAAGEGSAVEGGAKAAAAGAADGGGPPESKRRKVDGASSTAKKKKYNVNLVMKLDAGQVFCRLFTAVHGSPPPSPPLLA